MLAPSKPKHNALSGVNARSPAGGSVVSPSLSDACSASVSGGVGSISGRGGADDRHVDDDCNDRISSVLPCNIHFKL